MLAAVDDLASVEEEDFVSVQNRGEAVGHHHGGFIRQNGFHAVLDLGFGMGVNGGGGLVHDDQFRLESQGPGKADKLFFSLGNVLPAFRQLGIQAEVLPADEFVQLHDVNGFAHFGFRDSVIVNAHVFQNTAGKEEDVLQDQPDFAAPGPEFYFAQRHAVDEDAAFVHGIKAAEQAHSGGLAAAGSAHQRYLLPFGNGEGNVLEHPVLVLIGEPDVFEANLMLE